MPKNKKVLVVGDIIVDLYIVGENYRISDEAPVPILEVDDFILKLGGASNVANNIKNMGVEVILCGAIGSISHDKNSVHFLEEMRKQNLLIDYIVEGDMRTTVKNRVVIKEQQVVRFDIEDIMLSSKIIKDIITKLEKINFEEIGMVIVSDYKKGAICHDVMQFLKSKDVKIIVDPKPGNEDLYHKVFCITPNLGEFNKLTFNNFHKDNLNDIKTAAEEYRKKMCFDCLIITLGELGALCCAEEGCKIISNHKVEVTNTIGAGDTFLSALCYAIMSGEDIFSSTMIANIGASISVSKKYTSVCSVDEIKKYIIKQKCNE